MGDLPPKLFFRIGEVAGLVGVEPHVLRYWEREFRSIRPTKSAKGQRVYSRKDVENLLRVRDLLYRDGFTIAGAKKRLHHSATAQPLADEPSDSSEAYEDEASSQDVGAPTATATAVAQPSASSRIVVGVGGVGGEAADDERSTREKLVALRDEVESFLAELSTPGPR